MNKFKMFILSGSTLFILAACGTDEPAETTNDEGTDSGTEEIATQTFTLDELSQYNGQNGQPAYVAVDGIVYDVTDNDAWTEGEHAGQPLAGTDASSVIEESPHGDAVLEDLPIVGELVE